LEDLGVDERLIIKLDLKETELERVDWIHLVSSRGQWRRVLW
jgi:hypothetical protein